MLYQIARETITGRGEVTTVVAGVGVITVRRVWLTKRADGRIDDKIAAISIVLHRTEIGQVRYQLTQRAIPLLR